MTIVTSERTPLETANDTDIVLRSGIILVKIFSEFDMYLWF
jgi:hypothetical protein